jgi:hypothetical protein
MGKFLAIITSPLTLVDRDLGNLVRQVGFAAIGNSIGGPIGAAVGTAIAGGIATLTQPRPKPPTLESAQKNPISPRISGYGENRLQGAYILYDTSPRGWACDAWAYHDGRVDSIGQVYLGDRPVTRIARSGAGFGWVLHQENGLFGDDDDCIQIEVTTGQATESAFSSLVYQISDHWTTNHRGDGIVCAAMISKPVKAEDFATVYATGGPDRTPVSLAMRLQPVFDWRDNTQSPTDPLSWKWSANAILHVAHYLMVRDNKDWATHFAPTLSYWTAAANVCDQDIPLAGVQTTLAGKAEEGDTSVNLFTTNGLAPGMTIAIKVSGDSAQTETRTVTSISGAFVSFSGGLDHEHPQGAEVSWASSAGSPATEKRYRGAVVHSHTDPHKDVIARLLACCDGWLAPRADGALVVYAGEFQEPDVEIGPGLIASYSIQDGVDEESAVNSLKVSYISAPHDFATVQTDDWTDEDNITARGKILSQPLSNDVPSHAQARRLAKRAMAETSARFRGTVTTLPGGRIALGRRYITLRIVEAGVTFYDGPAQIRNLSHSLMTGSLSFDWIQADPNVDAWEPETEEGLPAPVGNRQAGAILTRPIITGAVATFAPSTDGGTGVRITITAAGLNREDVGWFARWRIVGNVTWVENDYPDIDAGPSVELQTGFVPVQSDIEVEVAYQTGDGSLSAWSEPFEVDSRTDADPPDDAATITVVSWADTLSLVTDRISRASSYRWRFYGADGTTLVRQIITSTPSVSYTAGQAATDGARRSYVVTVSGVNGGGAGDEASTGVISLPAPAAVTGVSATGGATNAEIAFTLSTNPAVAGYLVPFSTVSAFDPLTQGSVSRNLGSSPHYLQGLAAGTFYTKVAAYDAWTDRPDLLNFSTEDDFVITTGGGGIGGGGGGGGGGYCVTTDTMILMADGTEKPAGELQVGDMLRTQHEHTLEWGDYPIEAIQFVEDDVLSADIGIRRMRATADHRIWLTGWVRMESIGVPAGRATVAKITVTDAHTYVSNGVLSHNAKQEF